MIRETLGAFRKVSLNAVHVRHHIAIAGANSPSGMPGLQLGLDPQIFQQLAANGSVHVAVRSHMGAGGLGELAHGHASALGRRSHLLDPCLCLKSFEFCLAHWITS